MSFAAKIIPPSFKTANLFRCHVGAAKSWKPWLWPSENCVNVRSLFIDSFRLHTYMGLYIYTIYTYICTYIYIYICIPLYIYTRTIPIYIWEFGFRKSHGLSLFLREKDCYSRMARSCVWQCVCCWWSFEDCQHTYGLLISVWGRLVDSLLSKSPLLLVKYPFCWVNINFWEHFPKHCHGNEAFQHHLAIHIGYSEPADDPMSYNHI